MNQAEDEHGGMVEQEEEEDRGRGRREGWRWTSLDGGYKRGEKR